MNIRELYKTVLKIDIFELPQKDELRDIDKGHTMGEKLFEYIETKLSEEQIIAIEKCIKENYPIEIHGAYEDHLDAIFMRHRLQKKDSDEFIVRKHNNTKKKFNVSRPSFIFALKDEVPTLIVFVFPSPEYVFQYSEIILGWIKYNSQKPEFNKISCFLYPKLSESIEHWTKLNEISKKVTVKKGDILIIGYVEIFSNVLKNNGFESKFENDFHLFGDNNSYGVNVFRHPKTKKRCILLGVKFSFWGSASSNIVDALIKLGVRKVIYAAKAGARIIKTPEDTSPSNITGSIYSITGPYFLWEYTKHTKHDDGLISGPYVAPSGISSFVKSSPFIEETRTHLSVPSVIGETRKQERDYHSTDPTTIDNEISHIAKLIHSWNDLPKNIKEQCELSCIHYITDYVTSSLTRDMDGVTGLNEDDQESKKQQLADSYESIIGYINGCGEYDGDVYPEFIGNVENVTPEYPFDYLYDDFGIPPLEYRYLENDGKSRKIALSFFPEINKGSTILKGNKAINSIDTQLKKARKSTIQLSGGIGYGKSIFLSSLFYEYFVNAKKGKSNFAPLYIDISSWQRKMIGNELSEDNLNDIIDKIQNAVSEITDKMKRTVIYFIDGLDENCENSRRIFQKISSSLQNCDRIIAKRIYPFEKWEKDKHKTNSLVPYDILVNIVQLDKSKLHKIGSIINIDSDSIETIHDKYHKLFGSMTINYRLFCILAKEDFSNEKYNTASEFLMAFVSWYMAGINSEWKSTKDDFFNLSKIPFDFLMVSRGSTICPEKKLLDKRISTQSEEMIYFLCANFVCETILGKAEDMSSDKYDIGLLDHIYHNRINRYAKEILNFNTNTQSRYLSAIELIYDIANIRLKAFMAYLCGRFESEITKKKAIIFLQKIKSTINLSEFNGDELVLNRTVYISLIYLGDRDSVTEYIELMRSHAQWDAVNRGFHLSYYEDKDYYRDPDMSMIDTGEPFQNTLYNLEEKILSSINSDDKESQVDLIGYTLFSLFLNRYYANTIEDTISLDDAVTLGQDVLERNQLCTSVYNFISFVTGILKQKTNPLTILANYIYNLKTTKRSGWNHQDKIRNRSVNQPESVADHTYSVMMIALTFLPETEIILHKVENNGFSPRYKDYDKDKIIRMLLVHDFPESVTGDIPSFQKNSGDEDHEKTIVQQMVGCSAITSNDIDIGNLYIHIEEPWTFFEKDDGNINTAIAKEIDAIECYGQLIRYLENETTIISDTKTFKDDLRKRVSTTIGKQILNIIEKQ